MSATMPILTGDKAVIYLAEMLDRARGLSDTESRILDRALTRTTPAFRRWTAEEDARLLKMHKAKIKGTQIAATLGRSEDSVRCRLRDLKKAQKVKRNG